MFSYLIMIFISAFSLHSQTQNDIQDDSVKMTFINPVSAGADPWYLKKENFYYYCFSSNNSIFVSRSRFLTKREETKKVWIAPASGWNRSCVWAPELHYFDGHWYIYYAAGESGPPYIYQRTGVLQSATDDPFSNYSDLGMLYTGDNPDMKNDNRWAIDMNVFEYRNKLYAVWSGWIDAAQTDKTSQYLYMAEMLNPFTMKGLRTKISGPDQSWETGGPLDLEEGPEALIKNGNLFIVYSCRESWTINYRLGLLRLRNNEGTLLSSASWEKTGPVFQGPFGVGHCSFTTSPDEKEDWIIYHSKKSTFEGWERDIRMQPFSWNKDGYPDFGKAVMPGAVIKRPSGEYEIEKQIK
jgi:GH43 family beta-xylosidase